MIGGQAVSTRRPSDADTKSIPQDAVCALCGEPIFKEECSQGVHIYCQRCGFRDSVAHVHCVPRSMLAKNTPWWKWLFHRGHAEVKKSPNGRRGVIVPGCDACTIKYMTDRHIDKVFIRHVEYLLGTRENLRGLLQGKPSAHVLKQLDVNRKAEQSLEHGIDDFVTRAHSEGRKIGNTFGKEEREIVERYDRSPQMSATEYAEAWRNRKRIFDADGEEERRPSMAITQNSQREQETPLRDAAHLRQKIVEEIKAANPEQVERLRRELKMQEALQMREDPCSPELNDVTRLERHILLVRERLLNICCLLGIDAEISEEPLQRDQGASARPAEEMADRVRYRVHRLHVVLNECVSLQGSIIKSLEELNKLLEVQGLLR